MANILHDSLRESSLYLHFLLRGDPVTYSRQRSSFIFTWRGLKLVVPARDLQITTDPAAALQKVLASLVQMGGYDQPPGRHIRFRSHKSGERAIRTIRFTFPPKTGLK